MIFPELSDTGPLVAVFIRILAPILILRWPLGGMVVSMLADTLDVVIVATLRTGTFKDYTSLDKLLDTYSLGFAASVSLQWKNRIARHTSIALFTYRLAGVLALALTGYRWVLFLFPNVFEFFYLYHVATLKWFRAIEVDRCQRLVVALVLLTLMKLVQEYVLHVGGFYSLSYLWGAVIVTVLCCLPTGLGSITYTVLHLRRTGSGDATLAAKAKMWGLITLAVGTGFVIFWVGLAGLRFADKFGSVV